MQKEQKSTGLIWFKNNLRISDNITIDLACKKHDQIIAIYIFDKNVFDETIFGFKKMGVHRAQFLIETVQQLKENLAQKNISLLTFVGVPEQILPKICNEYNITEIFAQKEWTSEEVNTYEKVEQKIQNDCKISYSYDQFLYHPEDINIEFKNIPSVFSNFRRKVEKYISIRKESTFEKRHEENLIETTTTIPDVKALGYPSLIQDRRTSFPFTGGENEALKRIDYYFFESKKISFYKETRNGLLGANYSSKLSPWLANGSISAKTIYWKLKEYELKHGGNESTYWLVFELIWRDYFKYISIKHGNELFKIGGILQKKYEWSSNELEIQNWIHGRTNEPFVNANMIELKETGFMSNRGRQNVASYFSKELLLDWRIGAAYFESMLVDFDVHSNYGNWLYLSGVGNDPRDRKFNIKVQAERYDSKQEYQNHWLKNTHF